MFNNIYRIDFDKLVFYLTPTFLRRIKLYNWLRVIVSPIAALYSTFMSYRDVIRYRLNHNSQVCYLQAVLNDAFDNIDRRIIIKSGGFLQPLYVYTPPEERPVYIGKEYIYTTAQLEGGQSDFIVQFPIALKPVDATTLQGYLNDIESVVNEYKLASKTYEIQWI